VARGVAAGPAHRRQITIRAARANTVAVEFSSNCRPTSPGDGLVAMIPEPTTESRSHPSDRATCTKIRTVPSGYLGADR
jgi:hypothetical protein